MEQDYRYLITSSDTRTWKFDRPSVFLGHFCLANVSEEERAAVDGIVALPYGLGQKLKDADNTQSRKIESDLFPCLVGALNDYHGTQHGERFWRILLGHWLRRYVDIILNRTKTLEKCFEDYSISGTSVLNDDLYVLGVPDSGSAIWAANDARWNLALTARLLAMLNFKGLTVEVVDDCESTGFVSKAASNSSGRRKKVLRWVRHQASQLLTLFSRDEDAVVLNSYLPKKTEVLLQLLLGQVPQIWSRREFEVRESYDRKLRMSLAKGISKTTNDRIRDIAFDLVFELIPVCFLEGFVALNAAAQGQGWPKSPKFIFTSNSFDEDEVFKLWTATQAEAGSKYIVGQHGNNYGTYRYMFPSIEEITPDKFLTWGWRGGLSQHSPAFVLKTAGCKRLTPLTHGGLLLIQDMYYHRLDTWDRSAEHIVYMEEQARFVRGLACKPYTNLTVRLHASFSRTNPGERENWDEIDPEVRVETGSADIKKLIGQSRLVVHAFDSTGILELLSQDFPMLAFWQNGTDHLRDSAKPSYQNLMDVGVIHPSPESAASKVNEIWEDVDSWWNRAEVQRARRDFCKIYAKESENAVQDLRRLLMVCQS